MTKFKATTLIAVTAVAAALLFTGGAVCAWTLILIAGLWLVIMVLGVSFIRLQFFGEALCRGPVSRKRVALTFDDGPDEKVTPAVLDALGKLGVRGAFFSMGRKVREFPEITRRIVEEGHIACNHSDGHGNWTNFLFGRALRREIRRAQDAIFEAAGRRPRFFRPPMGLTNPHFRAALKRLGMIMVGWDVRTFDRSGDVGAVVERAQRLSRPGSVILLHDAGVDEKAQVEAVTGIVERLREKGFEFERLDELLGQAAWLEGEDN